ncbi:MAG: hypothetical protein ACRDG3_07095, partial [Tepidiformaceae bacterium]
MDHGRRRTALSVALFGLLLALFARGASLPHSATAAAAINVNSDENAAWALTSPVLTPPVSSSTHNPNPPRLYAGDISHPLPADASSVDNEPTTGYCVNISSSGLLPALVAGDGTPIAATDMGFRLVASNPIDPTAPPLVVVPIPESVAGAHDGVARFKPTQHQGEIDPTALTRKTVPGDAFCVVAKSLAGYQKLEISWNYVPDGSSQSDSTAVHVLQLAPLNHLDSSHNPVTDSVSSPDNSIAPFFGLQVATVTLTASGPNAGGSGIIGTVCTVGWDQSFLTGSTTNSGAPNPLNNLGLSDYSLTALTGGPSFVANQTDVPNPFPVGSEWCVHITTTLHVASTADVQLHFSAVYNIQIIADDQSHLATLPAGKPLVLTGNYAVTNVSGSGATLPGAVSPQYVTGAPATACIPGTVATYTDSSNVVHPGTDVLSPAGVHFTSAPGPDVAVATALQVGTASSLGIPGQAPGTICIRFTSFSAGEVLVDVAFTTSGTPVTAGWEHTDSTGTQGGPLLVDFNRIDKTEITSGLDPAANIVTGSSLGLTLGFNAADGTFIGSTTLTEWVIGSHNTGGIVVSGPVDGASLRASITGTCGYFNTPDTTANPPYVQHKSITGVSVGGRLELNDGGTNPLTPAFGDTDAIPDDLQFTALHDAGCVSGSLTGISVDVSYPGTFAAAEPTETVSIQTNYSPPLKTPRLAWIGDTVDITYAFSTGSSGCANENNVIDFVRAANQPGTFLPGDGISILGPDHAQSTFAGCTATVSYKSVDPGEVDIEAFINGATNTNISKVAYPIFYMALEDAVSSATPSSVVSAEANLSTTVRGWFLNDQPSSRPEEKTPDGRDLPAGRWVMPDDWTTLQGPGGFRNNWGSAEMPAVNVTYFMENEGVQNGWYSQVTNGSSGWFIPNTTFAYSFNINPITGQPSVLGTLASPRIISDITDLGGNVSVSTFGDFNLTYEACGVNKLTQNPICNPGDIVGHSRYYAIADYRNDPGKYPPILSGTVQTDWTWAGYKQVTVEDGPAPSQKYVVVHMKDRDGFCDAIGFNNLLGVPISFDIDSGDGIILQQQGQPVTVNSKRRSAVVTAYDTVDDLGTPVHTDISQPTVDTDECQAWILVSNSLLTSTNVLVTIPSTPAPPTGELRITNVQCTAPESITVTNEGWNSVSLEGYALKSFPSNPAAAEEHLGLSGVLAPGESASFHGGPNAQGWGWLNNSSGFIFDQGQNDYARLVWNGFQESYLGCNGQAINPPIPVALPSSGEGNTQFDVFVNFAGNTPTLLNPGWNLVTAGQGVTDLATVLAGQDASVSGVYYFDDATSTWQRYLLGTPGFVNTLT